MNIRRIFIVLLTTLVVTAVSLVTSLYLTLVEVEDPFDDSKLGNALKVSMTVSLIILVAGIGYAVFSKRLSREETRP